MAVSRRRYRRPNGDGAVTDRYRGRFVDARGASRELYLFRSKRASETALLRIRRLVEAAQGGEALEADLLGWVAELPQGMRHKLERWGVVDPRRIASTKPLAEHVAAWRDALEAKGNTDEHVRKTVRQVELAFDETGVDEWRLIDVDALQRWLRSRTGPAPLWSAGRHNAYVQSLRQFGKWMVTDKRTTVNRLEALENRSKGKEAPRRPRGFLTKEKGVELIQATRSSGVAVHGCPALERSLVYQTALWAGMRSTEIHDVCVRSLKWGVREGGPRELRPGVLLPPAVGTKAGKSTGRVDPLVLPNELEDALREFTAASLPSARVFPNWPKGKGAEILRVDLERIGVPYVDDGHFLDFHALRHTYGTWLGSLGLDPRLAQSLMRHSDPKLTAHYTHVQNKAAGEGADALPKIGDAS